MSLMLVQLSDIHIRNATDHILGKGKLIANAIVAELTENVDLLVLLFSGDMAFSGKPEEYNLAKNLFGEIEDTISSRVNTAITKVIIPGNHDCDFSSDQSARNQLLQGLNADRAPKSVEEVVLHPLTPYFTFAHGLAGPSNSINADAPYFQEFHVRSSGKSIRFVLLNSAWTSTQHESQGSLCYPISSFTPSEARSADYVICAIHHPLHWFKQPDVMRPLREQIERFSDLIFTGHEHVGATYDRSSKETRSNRYIEGDVLADSGDPHQSGFILAKIDLNNSTQELVRAQWSVDKKIYSREVISSGSLSRNGDRSDVRFRVTQRFNDWLEDPELPLGNLGTAAVLRLSDFFTYPDLREAEESSASATWTRIKSDEILQRIQKEPKTLITGTAKSGKTSLAKRLFQDFAKEGLVPILLTADSFRNRSESPEKVIARALKEQYQGDLYNEYLQLPKERRLIIIDDLERSFKKHDARVTFLRAVAFTNSHVIVFGGDEYCLEEIRQRERVEGDIWEFQRFDICEFGYLRIDALARKWLAVQPSNGDNERDVEVERVCSVIHKVLIANVIPHHPWILIVLLQQANSTVDLAAKNGSYGHLYQAVITAALARSRLNRIDITTKYTYLAELASFLVGCNCAELSESRAREFHRTFEQKYDINISFDDLVKDLDGIGLLRYDDQLLSFHAKYTFCFFLAWYYSQNLYDSRVRERVRGLCRCTYHEESANTLVFLAHLSSDPLILEEMQSAARTIFAGSPLFNMDSDVAPLNKLGIAETVKISDDDPNENRRRMLDAKDEELAARNSSEYDGRNLKPTVHEDANDDEYSRFIRELDSAMKTIQILGQVLRNGVGSISGAQKIEIVNAIFELARRVLGFAMDGLETDIADWKQNILQRMRKKEFEIALGKVQEDRTNTVATLKPTANGLVALTEEERALSIMPNTAKLQEKANSQMFSLALLATFRIVKHVSDATGLRLLSVTFQKVIDADPALPNRVFDLSIDFDNAAHMPKDKAKKLFIDLTRNMFGQTLVQWLVAHHLYLYKVPERESQAIRAAVGIDRIAMKSHDPARKLN